MLKPTTWLQCLAWAGLTALAGCAAPPPLTTQPNLTAQYTRAHIEARNDTLAITYPVITAPNATPLNSRIESWIGTLCPLPDTDGDTLDVNSARACLDAMAAVCRDQDDPGRVANACAMNTRVDVATNTHDVLGLVLAGSIFMGGAHGTNYRIYRNLRLSTASRISAADLLSDPTSGDLQALIEARIRQQYQLGRHDKLTSAGFFDDHFAPTDNVLIQTDGLRFTYQNYEIGPYALGQPTAFLPYAAVEPMMRRQLAIMQAGDPAP